jgi:hypothetical protein
MPTDTKKIGMKKVPVVSIDPILNSTIGRFYQDLTDPTFEANIVAEFYTSIKDYIRSIAEEADDFKYLHPPEWSYPEYLNKRVDLYLETPKSSCFSVEDGETVFRPETFPNPWRHNWIEAKLLKEISRSGEISRDIMWDIFKLLLLAEQGEDQYYYLLLVWHTGFIDSESNERKTIEARNVIRDLTTSGSTLSCVSHERTLDSTDLLETESKLILNVDFTCLNLIPRKIITAWGEHYKSSYAVSLIQLKSEDAENIEEDRIKELFNEL